MAAIVQEPSDNNPETLDWQRFLYRTTLQGGGFLCLMLGNSNSDQEPYIMAGSRLEVNSSFYYVENNEQIIKPNAGLINNTQYYIYAVPQTASLNFQYIAQNPVYDPMRGGWFSGTMRAVARVFYINGQYINKVIMDNSTLSGVGGTWSGFPAGNPVLIANGRVGAFEYYDCVPGVYQIQLCGGKGGSGGKGGKGGNGGSKGRGGNYSFPGEDGNNGMAGQQAIPFYTSFILDKLTKIALCVGADGNAGGNGADGVSMDDYPPSEQQTFCGIGGGGAGGGAGGKSSIAIVPGIGVFESIGGSGGSGGRGGRGTKAGYSQNGNASNGYGFIGGKGGQGGAPNQVGGDGDNAEVYINSYNIGNSVGGIGGGFSSSSSGYARLYRIQ